ncbi:MAG: hypothetical protein ACP5UA_05435 [Candidatus Hydrogenedens sp.]
MSFWVWYDYMGTWFFFNVSFICPLLFLAIPLLSYDVGYFSLLGGFLFFLMVAYFYFVNVFVSAFTVTILEHKEGFREKLIYALKIVVFKAGSVFFLFALFFLIVWVNIRFYISSQFFNFLWVRYILLGLFMWFGLFSFISLLWVVPSLSFKKISFWKYVYWGYVLLLANPYFSFQVLFCYTILCILNMFPLFFFFMGMVMPSIFLTCAYEILSRKYEAIQTSGDKLEDYQIFRDYEDEFLNRSWEHLIKPWKL